MAASVHVLSPSQRFRRIFGLFEKIAEFIGVNVMPDDYRFTFVTYVLFMFIVSFFSVTSYTIYVGVVIENDWLSLIQSFTVAGLAVQGVVKLINAIINAPTFRILRRQIASMYETYERKDAVYHLQLTNTLQLLLRTIFIFAFVSFAGMLGLICVPLVYRYVLKQKVLLVEFIIPGLDPTTDVNYVTYLIVQVICIVFGILGNLVSDALFLILVIHIPLIKDILKCKFNDLDKVLQEYPRDASKSGLLLKDIFLWHQHYIDFSLSTKDCFFWVIFAQIFTTTNSIICTIICQFLGIMPAAPAYLVYSFVVLYTYAGVGNLVDISNDDVITDIYDSYWYLLTVPEQKMILIMLRESQQTEGMSIGGVSPLSLNAALQITKTIYSVAMMLNRFFSE